MEFENRLILVKKHFGIDVEIIKSQHMSEININAVTQVDENKYKNEPETTLFLDYDDIDEIIRVLKYVSDELKRADNEYAGK